MKNNLNKQEALDVLREHGYDAEINEDVLIVHCGIKNARQMIKTLREYKYLGSFMVDKERGDNVGSAEET